MPLPPAAPKIYHITNVDNLPSIIGEGGLRPDSLLIASRASPAKIGMTAIKRRRLGLPLPCHAGDRVADYVPFYFCPRSVMLYLIHRGNHPELTYQGGQVPIVHLEAELGATVAWADRKGSRWAFSLSNAGAYYTQFRKNLAELSEINWPAVAATDFKPSDIKEGKQAEFLLHGAFPWPLVSRIGVYSQEIALRAHAALDTGAHRPAIQVRKDCYF
jgi:hypothetical protein